MQDLDVGLGKDAELPECPFIGDAAVLIEKSAESDLKRIGAGSGRVAGNGAENGVEDRHVGVGLG